MNNVFSNILSSIQKILQKFKTDKFTGELTIKIKFNDGGIRDKPKVIIEQNLDS